MNKLFKDKMFWVKALFFVLAVLIGGSAMAVEIGENGSDTDPNDGKPLEDATHDNPGKGIDQQGHAATGSSIDQAGLADNKVEDYVSKFQSFKYPMHTDFLRMAKQVKVDTKEPSHFSIGEAVMECHTKSAVDNSTAKDNSVILSLYKNDIKLFSECATIIVPNVDGYDTKGDKDGSPLMLYVESSDKTNGVSVIAINGPLDDNGSTYVPDIPASTELLVMAPAMSESEIEIAPDAAYPTEEKAYLQKKVCAITWTEFFERIKKKASWNVTDLKGWILANFRKRCTRTMLIGAGSKFSKTNPKTGTEYVYTQKGVLRQLRLGYQIPSGGMTVPDLIAITKMLGGKFATTSQSEAYVSPKFMEGLLNMDFSKYREVTISQEQSKDLDLDFFSFKTPFHKLVFKIEHALEDIHFDEAAIIFPMSTAKRYYYQKGKTINVNHEKGEGGEVREAKSQYYVQDDCLMLTGYNSMLVAKDLTVGGYGKFASTIKSVSVVPVIGLVNGDKYYLTQEDGEYGVGLYMIENGEFVPFKGEILAD
ncbi:MAG TPA: hypothetical protein DD441_03550 [Parabacteroides distasonis]|nr:hypothetical protein [Parabacteroides distasonis]